MNEHESKSVAEANIEALLSSSIGKLDSASEKRLVGAVLEEVQNQRRQRKPRRRAVWRLAVITGAVAVIAVIGVILTLPESEPIKAGRVTTLYGMVTLRNGLPPLTVMEAQDIRSDQWIEVLSGSQAEIVLGDQTRLCARPRTMLQIKEPKYGSTVVLEEGSLTIEAAKQQPGEHLSIETPGATIRILGTKLGVHVARKKDGRSLTRVCVASGKVEIEAAGQTVSLLPNMEGVVEEGEPPVRQSITEEVNEMIRLIELGNRLAAEHDVSSGSPAIVDVSHNGTATVWTVLTIENQTDAPIARYSLRTRYPAARAKAFSLEGARLATKAQGNVLDIDFSQTPIAPGAAARVVLKVPDARGLFRAGPGGTFEFDRPGSGAGIFSLFQFRLPEFAQIDRVSPQPMETRTGRSRLFVTVWADSTAPPLVE